VRSLPVDKISVTLGPNAVRPYRAAWDARKRFSFLGLFPDPGPDVLRQTFRFGHVNQSSRGRTLCPSWECRIAPWRTTSHFPGNSSSCPSPGFSFPILDFRSVASDVPRASLPAPGHGQDGHGSSGATHPPMASALLFPIYHLRPTTPRVTHFPTSLIGSFQGPDETGSDHPADVPRASCPCRGMARMAMARQERHTLADGTRDSFSPSTTYDLPPTPA
jgi:hypothetical protein